MTDDPAEPPPESLPTWALATSSSGNAWSVDIAEAPDGTYAVAGGFHGTGIIAQDTPAAAPLAGIDESDSFLARVDAEGVLLWVQVMAGLDFTDVRGLDVGPDGAVYACGFFWDTITFAAGTAQETTFTTLDGEDGFVACYESTGSLRWARQVTGTGLEDLNDVAAMPDGAVVVAGLYADPITLGAGEITETTLTPTGYIEAMVFCYAPDGKLRWATSTSTTVLATAWSIAAAANGDISVTGDYEGSATFGTGEANETTIHSVAGSGDIFVARYNLNGNLLWVRSNGGSDFEYSNRVLPAPEGGVRITGIFASTATFSGGTGTPVVLTSAGRHDGYLASYDALGNLQWAAGVGGPEPDEYFDARVLANGSTVVLGYFTGTATVGAGQPGETVLTADSPTDEDVVMAGYGPTGQLVWATSFGGPGNDNGVGLAPVSDGTWIVTGSYTDALVFDGVEVLTGDLVQTSAFFARVGAMGNY